MEVVHRSEGSIERKLQNVSAVPDVLGAQWINGYKPLAHYQDALVEAVARAVAREPRFLDPGSAGTPLPTGETAILVPAPALRDPDETLTPAVPRLVARRKNKVFPEKRLDLFARLIGVPVPFV